jgi:hypothetical protein
MLWNSARLLWDTSRTRRELQMELPEMEKFKKVGKIESSEKCRISSLWARMAEETKREVG